MKKLIVLCACVLMGIGSMSAQNYQHELGLRLGGSGGITYRYNLSQSNAIEGILSTYWYSGVSITGLYEWKQPVINNDFYLYYGAGIHLGAFRNHFALGVDGIVGLEYQIPTVPIALSLDYKPGIHFLPIDDWWVGLYDVAFSVKFTF